MDTLLNNWYSRVEVRELQNCLLVLKKVKIQYIHFLKSFGNLHRSDLLKLSAYTDIILPLLIVGAQ